MDGQPGDHRARSEAGGLEIPSSEGGRPCPLISARDADNPSLGGNQSNLIKPGEGLHELILPAAGPGTQWLID